MDRKILIVLALLIIAGFAIRAYDLSYHSYWMDESYSIKSTQNMETNILPCLNSGLSYHRHLPYSAVLFIFTRFGYDEFITRLPSVIFGVLLIPVIFFYSRRIFKDDYTALIPTILITFSQFFIAWSRQARHYSLLVLLFFMSLYLLDAFMQKPDKKNLLYLLAVTILAMMTHAFGAVLLVIYAAAFALNRKSLKKMKISTSGAASISAVMLGVTFYVLGDFGWLDIRMNYLGYYLGFIIDHYFVFFALSFAGIYIMRKNQNTVPLMIGAIAAIAALSFFVHLQAFRYLIYITPLLFIFSAPALAYMPGILGDKRLKAIAMLIIMAIAMSSGFIFMPKSQVWLEPETPQPDIRAAINSIDVKDDDVIITVYTSLTELYLKKPDYWLAFDFSRRDRTEDWIKDGKDRYANVTPILDYRQFKDVTGTSKGYIILDEMSSERIDKDIIRDIENLDLVFAKDDGPWRKVWVYRFNSY